MEFDKKALGKRIKNIRMKNNFTQEFVAEKANITTNTYGNIERGQVTCGLSTLIKITKVLNVSLKYLLLNKDDAEDDNEIHKLIKSLDIIPSYYAEEMIINYIKIRNYK